MRQSTYMLVRVTFSISIQDERRFSRRLYSLTSRCVCVLWANILFLSVYGGLTITVIMQGSIWLWGLLMLQRVHLASPYRRRGGFRGDYFLLTPKGRGGVFLIGEGVLKDPIVLMLVQRRAALNQHFFSEQMIVNITFTIWYRVV